ncbi:ParB N-terminal domain-containing protein [Pyxidicoccus parkwayensis]|uniref:ParB N-terminal domain-containing protein n=1 Tax=Pyxidicoccus parkwayensis TaxID=2813578 RepID=A0ABX7P3P5_9BACT|nr:ParB N-terminal domain-containing protein [Pyxidicoccus parkwaysis]QSQ25066.1 ParB N-terminal domain-containing protein [Pyxidicoccus parkwaysis]
MDAEHRVDGQEGMTGTSPEGGSQSSEHAQGQSRSEGGPAEGTPGEHRAEGGSPGESHNGSGHPSEGGPSGEQPHGGEPSQAAPAEPGAPSPGGEPGAEAAAQAGSEPQGEESHAGEEAHAGAEDASAQTAEDESGQEGDEGEEEELPEELEAPEERLAGRVTLVLMPLEKLQDDTAFRLRPEGDVSGLATDIARLGQLFPVDVRPAGEDRYQLVCGFRRVAALRFLKRDAVQARVHTSLSDEDALLMSLAEAIHATPVEPEVLEAKREELESQGRLSAAVRDMLEKALATEDTLAPEGVEEEIDADELAADVSQRLGAINQDLSLLADVFAALDDSRKAELLMQLRYSSELVAYLEGL